MEKITREWRAERAARARNSLRWGVKDIAIAALFSAILIATAINVVEAIESLPK